MNINQQRLRDFLNDNVGNDNDLAALTDIVTQRGITDYSNVGLAKAYDEVLRLRSLKADGYQLVADTKPEWKDLSDYEKLVLLGKDKQKQFYDEYMRNIVDINQRYANAYELPETDRIHQLGQRRRDINILNSAMQSNLNNTPEPKNWYYDTAAPKTETNVGKSRQIYGERIPAQPKKETTAKVEPTTTNPKPKPTTANKSKIPPFLKTKTALYIGTGIGTLALINQIMSNHGEQSNAQLYAPPNQPIFIGQTEMTPMY